MGFLSQPSGPSRQFTVPGSGGMKYGVRNCKLKQTWPDRERTDWHNNAQPGSLLWSVRHPVREEGGLLGRRESTSGHERLRELELQLVTSYNYFPRLSVQSGHRVATNHHILSGPSLTILCFNTNLQTGYLIFDIYTYLCQIYMTEIPIESFHNF